MTNGEKIIAILKPRKDQIRIYDNWVEIEIQKLGINFSCELDWWNTECNEPSNKSIIYKAKESKEIQEDLDKLRKLNEPTTKNDLGVDYVSRQAVDNLAWEYLRKATDENIAFYEHFLDLPSVTPQEPILEKDGTLIVTTEHYGNVGRVLVQYGTNGTLFYQDQEPEIVPVAVVKFDEDKLREIVQEKVDEIKENLIEQYLDKITAEIEEAQTYEGIYIDRAYVLEIIDKYKAESEK